METKKKRPYNTGPYNNRDRALLRTIIDFISEAGFPPSIRDLVTATDASSTSAVRYRLMRLEKFGKIKRETKAHRGLEVLS